VFTKFNRTKHLLHTRNEVIDIASLVLALRVDGKLQHIRNPSTRTLNNAWSAVPRAIDGDKGPIENL
jgi:hypothetical protein